jgi:hypothetical protein
MRQVKCIKCGGLYVVVSENEAQQAIDAANTKSVARGVVPSASMESFLMCFHCNAPSTSFVDAPLQDVPPGCSLAPIVIVAPASPSHQSGDISGRTYLNIPYEMLAYAKLHGVIFDKIRHQYFVIGGVPLELMNFLPRQAQQTRPRVLAPDCPRCGYHTVLITETKNGGWFYGCSRYRTTGCKGSVDYEKHLSSIGVDGDISAIRALQKMSNDEVVKLHEKGPASTQLDKEHQEAIVEIARLGIDVLGNQNKFISWIVGPKLTLQGKTPTEDMRTREGCERVKALLLSMQ